MRGLTNLATSGLPYKELTFLLVSPIIGNKKGLNRMVKSLSCSQILNGQNLLNSLNQS